MTIFEYRKKLNGMSLQDLQTLKNITISVIDSGGGGELIGKGADFTYKDRLVALENMIKEMRQ